MTTESITRLLDAARGGDLEASQALFTAVYAELRKLARSHRKRWRGNQTMNTTALIHEAFVKLARPTARIYRELGEAGPPGTPAPNPG